MPAPNRRCLSPGLQFCKTGFFGVAVLPQRKRRRLAAPPFLSQGQRSVVGVLAVLLTVTTVFAILPVTLTEAGSLYSEVATDGELEFRFLGVAASAWGGGIASALVRECLAIADARGLDTAICTRDNNDRALRLYQGLGFARVPERDYEPVPGVLLQVLVRPCPG